MRFLSSSNAWWISNQNGFPTHQSTVCISDPLLSEHAIVSIRLVSWLVHVFWLYFRKRWELEHLIPRFSMCSCHPRDPTSLAKWKASRFWLLGRLSVHGLAGLATISSGSTTLPHSCHSGLQRSKDTTRSYGCSARRAGSQKQARWTFSLFLSVMTAVRILYFLTVSHCRSWRTSFPTDLDVITPTLDGTILPGVTRASCLALLEAHTSQKTELPNIPPTQRLHAHERIMTMHDLNSWSAEGKLVEAFVVGTGVIITPVGRIGFEGKDLVLPLTGLGPVSQALRERIGDIQTGKTQWNGWSVVLK